MQRKTQNNFLQYRSSSYEQISKTFFEKAESLYSWIEEEIKILREKKEQAFYQPVLQFI